MPLYVSDDQLSQISLQPFLAFIAHFSYTNLPYLPLEIWQQILFHCNSLKDAFFLLHAHSELKQLVKSRRMLRKQLLSQYVVCTCTGNRFSLRWTTYSTKILDITRGSGRTVFKMNLYCCVNGYMEKFEVLHWKYASGRTSTQVSREHWTSFIIELESVEPDMLMSQPTKCICDFVQKFIPLYHLRLGDEQLKEFLLLNFPYQVQLFEETCEPCL